MIVVRADAIPSLAVCRALLAQVTEGYTIEGKPDVVLAEILLLEYEIELATIAVSADVPAGLLRS